MKNCDTKELRWHETVYQEIHLLESEGEFRCFNGGARAQFQINCRRHL
jgi:hypothetical protein